MSACEQSSHIRKLHQMVGEEGGGVLGDLVGGGGGRGGVLGDSVDGGGGRGRGSG